MKGGRAEIWAPTHWDLKKIDGLLVPPGKASVFWGIEALFRCHDILILDKSPIKWKQRRDMTIADDWDAKPQLKQTNIKWRQRPDMTIAVEWDGIY